MILILDFSQVLVSHPVCVLNLHQLECALVVGLVPLRFFVFQQLAILEALLNFVLVDIQSVQINWRSVLFCFLFDVLDEHLPIFLDRVEHKVAPVVIFLHGSLYLGSTGGLHDLVSDLLIDALGHSPWSPSFWAKTLGLGGCVKLPEAHI